MNAFQALADPTRVSIIESLAIRPRTVNEVVGLFSMSQPAISHHLKVLRDAGLVTSSAEGQTRIYQLNPGPLQDMDRWLQRYRKFWAAKLDDLEQHLEANP